MDTMSIAALSVGMAQAQTAQSVDTAVLKLSMDTSAEGVTDLLDTIGESLDPNLGQNLDILA